MVSSRLTPVIKCESCNNVTPIVVQTPTEQLLSYMEIIPTPSSPASINGDTTGNLNHAILKLKKLAIEPDNNDLFFKKNIICPKCAKFMATEFSYHNLDEPGINAVIAAINEASQKINISEILKGPNLYDDLLKEIKEGDNKMIYFVIPYEDIAPLLKLNEIAENQNINLIIENLVSPSEESSPFTNASEQLSPVSTSTPTQPLSLSKINTENLNEGKKKRTANNTTFVCFN